MISKFQVSNKEKGKIKHAKGTKKQQIKQKWN